MSTRYTFQYSIYDAHRLGWQALTETLNGMSADGWEMREVVLAYSELYVLWQRPVPAEPAP